MLSSLLIVCVMKILTTKLSEVIYSNAKHLTPFVPLYQLRSGPRDSTT